ncbi:unnamed protein product [Ostreobium quekettii]|uniref:Kazal-like domain-containing protein n=1 Tax=Ostreobium quekettii TaxID=121088 RepID=A0A8S1J3G9_9CHLO|nr:unnamed protein product [Ostreobium quekettii]|eukprot:evm.model.scf_1423.3 EVM.evm.TU.scf_1423.3   scf_1423:29974-32124(-)
MACPLLVAALLLLVAEGATAARPFAYPDGFYGEGPGDHALGVWDNGLGGGHSAACTCAQEEQPAPVCGTDGNTYSSACEAECNGATQMCEVACPCVGFSNPTSDGYGVGAGSDGSQGATASSCPPTTPQVACFNDPCAGAFCINHPHAACRSGNCGGCYASFFVTVGGASDPFSYPSEVEVTADC